MIFTEAQYQEAIANLEAGRRQLNPDGNECSICGDGGHQAWECGHNPLLAMRLADYAANTAEKLHERLHAASDPVFERPGLMEDFHHFLHWLAGWESSFGVQLGLRKVVVPHPVTGAHGAGCLTAEQPCEGGAT